MLESLVADVAVALDGVEGGLPAAADVLRRHLEVDRVSISRVDEHEGSFEILSTSGAGLLVSGTRLPVATSSHFLAAAERRTFSVPRFTRDPTFERPLDEIVLAAGFGSGCAVPIRRGDGVVGAIALTSTAEDVDYAHALEVLPVVGGLIGPALDRHPAHAPPLLVLCHGDALVAHGLARIAEQAAGARTRVCTNLDDAEREVTAASPDLVVCDDHLGGVRVDGFLGRLRRAGAAAPVLVVATHDTAENRQAALSVGAEAYLPRAEAVHALPLAIATLRDGVTLLPPDDAAPAGVLEELTRRERELLCGLEEGLRMKQLARELGISEATVKTHARNVFRKLGATSRAEAVREARRQGVLD